MRKPDALLLFTKPARPGLVKTRLVGELSAVQTAELHAAFVGDLSERLSNRSFDLLLYWALQDDDEMPRDPPSVGSYRQRGEDLGERLYAGLSAAAQDYPRVAAVGSDHPELEPAVVEAGFALLDQGADVVLGPAQDGGFYLIGVRAATVCREIFDQVPWSTPDVLRKTRDNCHRCGLDTQLLDWGHDVDVPADLERLLQSLRTSTVFAPRTRRLLRGWGMLRSEVPA